MQVWKYPLAITDEQVVEMPTGARHLSVQVQHGVPCLWALVNPLAAKKPRVIRIVGTGHTISSPIGDFVGTFQVGGGALVFHVFDMGEQK